jgi:hypothetical protein
MQFVKIDHREFNLANVSYIEGEQITYREGSGGPPRVINVVRVYCGGAPPVLYSGSQRDQFLAAWKSYTGLGPP